MQLSSRRAPPRAGCVLADARAGLGSGIANSRPIRPVPTQRAAVDGSDVNSPAMISLILLLDCAGRAAPIVPGSNRDDRAAGGSILIWMLS